MTVARVIFLGAAVVCFILAAFSVPFPLVQLEPTGLALFAASFFFGLPWRIAP